MSTTDIITRKLTTSAAARLALCSGETIRAWERRGWLPAERTTTGVRLFEEEDVKRIARERGRRFGIWVA